jgi:hypothetical protein
MMLSSRSWRVPPLRLIVAVPSRLPVEAAVAGLDWARRTAVGLTVIVPDERVATCAVAGDEVSEADRAGRAGEAGAVDGQVTAADDCRVDVEVRPTVGIMKS